MKRTTMRLSTILALAPLALAGCVNPFSAACKEVAADPHGNFKYTEDQAAAACAEAQKYAHPELFKYPDEESEEKEKQTWRLDPQGLKAEDAEAVLLGIAQDLDEALSYENEALADAVDMYDGFREGLERQERLAHAQLDDLAFVRVWNEFTEKVGRLPESVRKNSDEFSYFFPNSNTKSYSLRLLYPHGEYELTGIPFTVQYLEQAKEAGVLERVTTMDYVTSQKFGEKEQSLRDPNEFSWQPVRRGWRIDGYKIIASDNGGPAENHIEYVEIYRLKDNLVDSEGEPAVRGFLPTGGSNINVFLIDYDREGAQGYGVPDRVWQTGFTLDTAPELISLGGLRKRLLDETYEPPTGRTINTERPERQKPAEEPIYISINQVGDVEIEMWEKGSFSVPFEYDSLSKGLKIEWAPFDPSKEPEKLEDMKKVDFFTRSFRKTSDKVVAEYWVPKEDYSQRDIVEGSAYGGTINLLRKGDLERKGEIEYFGKHIKAIDYRFGGKWFRLLDEDSDGEFEKKREIAEPSSGSSPSRSRSGV